MRGGFTWKLHCSQSTGEKDLKSKGNQLNDLPPFFLSLVV